MIARRRQAMTLIEAMISLAITATLLVALAAAFHASARAVETNDAYFRCTQNARLALDQITTEIRRADAVQVDPSGLQIDIIRPDNQLSAREIHREYRYDPAAKTVTLKIVRSGTINNPEYDLADNITEFRSALAASDRNDAVNSGCITITLTCSDGAASVTLVGSATPRRPSRPTMSGHEVLLR